MFATAGALSKLLRPRDVIFKAASNGLLLPVRSASIPRLTNLDTATRLTTLATSMNNVAAAESTSVRMGPISVLDPHKYTSGRWLNRDKLETDARYIKFDFDALCQHAVAICPGAGSFTECQKIEGGYNRVFVFTMDNGKRIVAKLPTSVAGPKRLTTNSEVATMAYIRSKTAIPIPTVLSWSDDPRNLIGTEYIFMEYVPGVQLHDAWTTMTGQEHIQCIRSVSMIMKEMTLLSFPGYGSVYFADAPLPPSLKIDIGQGFCIGPHCGSTYWNCGAGETILYGNRDYCRGPWSNIHSYCSSLIESGLSRMPRPEFQNAPHLPYRGSVDDHLRLLADIKSIFQELLQSPPIKRLAKPTLLHADLHKRNIFVSQSDPTQITGLIDWQSSSIEPAFIYARETPDFAAPYVDRVSPGTTSDDSTDNASLTDAERRKKIDMVLCSDAFEVCMKGFVPILGAARETDDTLLRLFRHCNTSWRNGIAAVRQDMLDLSRLWSDLGLQGTCPYSPSDEEIERHNKQYEDFEAVLSLKAWLIRTLDTNSDGWVPAEEWEQTKSVYREAFKEWMKTAEEAEASGDTEMSPDKASKLWPFDER